MKIVPTATVVLLSLVLFAIESMQENNNEFSNNALTIQKYGIFRRNRPFQQDVVRLNPVQLQDVFRPNLVKRDAVERSIDEENLMKDLMIKLMTSSYNSDEVNETHLDFFYWNSDLGNEKPIKIEFGNEKEMIGNWLKGKPLKVITHGWLSSDDDDNGVFDIKTAYVTVGGFNVITVDWSSVADDDDYMKPAYMTSRVGQILAKLLENFVTLAVIDPSDIHVIGHSLGAHVSGACGAAFGLGKIGRITGLDPAAPGFQDSGIMNLLNVMPNHLDSTDAQFVDVIHTDSVLFGYSKSIGSADFFPNGGNTQPGCKSLGCSHSRSYQLYADSVYHRNSLIAVMCPSWEDFADGICRKNIKSPMGHDANPKVRGIFYLKTNDASPYGILDA